MVKRRDKTGRRQILQLEDKKPPPVTKVPKKGLIHYSDSEDERTHPKPEPSVGSSSEKNSSVDTAPIDSQLADFMKEIDALQAEENQESSEAEPNSCVASSSNSEPVKSLPSEENGVLPAVQAESKEQVSESHTADDSVASTQVDMGVYCLWQECRDDSTGYSYYWNMQTNEVTWECPPEYLAYLQYLNSTVEPTTSQAVLPKASSSKGSRPTKKTKSKKDSASGLEGKIIPISYFGGSSSSEDSTDDSAECNSDAVVSSRSKLKKKSESSVSSQSGRSKLSNRDQGKKTSKEATVSKAEAIGPQLPPDFQFSEDVPVTPTTSVINSSLDGVPYVENEEDETPMIGPQLPAYYIPRENKVVEASPPPADQGCSTQEENQLTKVSTSDEVTVNGTIEQDPPQSTVDGSVAHTSSDGETWEESLLKIEEHFRNSDRVKKDQDEEEPDSTTKKETAQPVQTVNSSRTNDKILVRKPVVEYSSCTDDDEEEEMSTSSGGPACQSSYRPTNSNLIDSMFSFAHTSDKKFGFGFSKSHQLEMENDAFEAGFSQNRGKQPKRKMKGSYSKINFVKSKEVLDLNALNKCTVPEQEEVSSGKAINNLAEVESQPDVNLQNVSPQNENPAPAVDDVDCDEIDQALESALTEKVTESVTEKAVEPSTSEVMVEPSTSDTQVKKGKKHPADTEIKPDTAAKKVKQEEPETSMETSPSLTTSILDLSNILVDKLSFLVSSQSTMSSLTSLLIQMQTRLIDWQSGALDSKYFMDRLQEVDQYLHHYEMSSVTGDWMCQWDSEHKRYFYVNRRTQQSQWTFPPECSIQVAMQNKQLWENHISDIATASSTSSYPTAGGQFPLVSSSMSDERSCSGTSSGGIYVVKEEDPEHEMLDLYPTPSASWTCPAPRPQPSPPPPPPGVDSPPPPPPPITPPPASPPPPPPAPDSTELEEGEIPDVDMDVEDSNSSGSVIYSGKASQSDDLLAVPSNMLESCSSTGSPDHHPKISTSLVSSTSAINSEQLAIIVKPPQPVVSSSSGLVHVSGASNVPSTWAHTGPSCSSTQNSYHPIPMVADEASVVPGGASVPPVDSVTVSEVSETMFDNGNNMPTPSVTSVSSIQHPVIVASTSASTLPSVASTSGSSTGTSSKKEKKKSKLLPGLALKRKNIPNLVEKWVKIKKQQEKENKNADEARISTSM